MAKDTDDLDDLISKINRKLEKIEAREAEIAASKLALRFMPLGAYASSRNIPEWTLRQMNRRGLLPVYRLHGQIQKPVLIDWKLADETFAQVKRSQTSEVTRIY